MHSLNEKQALKLLGVDKTKGLSMQEVRLSRQKNGQNKMSKPKSKGMFLRVLGAFCDPMLIILCFALCLTFGVNLGRWLKGGEADFVECIGIFIAVLISVTLTVIMEGRSKRAFEMLSQISSSTSVKVRRDGEVKAVSQEEIVVGDVVLLSAGEKIAADGRVIESSCLTVDESTLTGESKPREKRADAVLKRDAPLAERINCVYGGTLVTYGSGEVVITAVGDRAEIGKIAEELNAKNKISSPLNQKLASLGKGVTLLGGVAAVLVFVVSLIRLIASGGANFDSIQELFIESVVLIVAAVPEGLPTIVAVSLSISVMKLAKENALIKKLVVAETAGCVSVICSDKTGTLTQNKMTVEKIIDGNLKEALSEKIKRNIALNTKVEVTEEGGKKTLLGTPTECAIVGFAFKNLAELDLERKKFKVVGGEEFSSQKKYSSAKTQINGTFCTFYKGSPERILSYCDMAESEKRKVLREIGVYAREARRILAFASDCGEGVVFDGFAVIADPVRADVKESVASCRRAGIDVKILTGDNGETAFAVGREVGIAQRPSQVLDAHRAEKMTDEELKKALKTVTVISRSTPLLKLRVVNLLKDMGEVVAVTGDGINDAPAIKQADIGIAMGSGSAIAKEAGDIVLLDDSFSTVVKAISFGRNVFLSFQRFITFQLSVNFSAVMTVLAFLFLGLKSPFNALQLLWLNIIMDGPPALTLGFEPPSPMLMEYPPKRREGSLVTKKIAIRIIFGSVYIAALTVLQQTKNFLGVSAEAESTATFTLFVFLQLVNAFNCRKVGAESVLKGFFANKAMLLSFGLVTLLQVAITQFGGGVFGTVPLSLEVWLKVVGISSTMLLIAECAKCVYRLLRTLNGGKFKVKTVRFGKS